MDFSLVLTLVICLLTGLGALWLGVPVPWLLGPLLAAVLLRLLAGQPRTRAPLFLILAQIVLGLNTGLDSRPDVLRIIGGGALGVAAVVIITSAASMFGGYLLTRWAGVDAASGFLGAVPGAASGIVGMSADLGADVRIVAALQYLRVVLVAIVTPLLVGYLPRAGPIMPQAATGAAPLPAAGLAAAPGLWALWPALAAGAALAWLLARVLRLPAPAFLGPFLFGLALSWSGLVAITVPAAAVSGALLLLGVNVGGRFDRETLRVVGRAAAVAVAINIVLFGVALLAGYIFHLITDIGVATSLLGAVPGAMEVVVASATELGADGSVVAAMHLIRFIAAALAGPWLARWLIRRAGPGGAGFFGIHHGVGGPD